MSRRSERRVLRGVGARDVRVIGAGTHVLRLGRGRVAAAVARLRRERVVRYAEPDFIGSASAANVPNDPSFGLQWGSQNTGQSVPSQGSNEVLGSPTNGTPGADDHAVSAWNSTTGSRSIVIGEPDTGINYTHPDLAANIWSNPGGIGGCPAGTHGYNFIANSCDPNDDDTAYGGHGTHVAGILGAVGNNGTGVAGMNWQTTILPVKWLGSNASGSTTNLISALDWLWAAQQAGVNVRVVNVSQTFAGTAFSQALSDEIDKLGVANILFVTAAGNTSQNNDSTPRYPCDYSRANEICVTASDLNDKIPSWANYGPTTVDLAAPGTSIYSTLRNNTYGYLSGGSMAAPQVAGAAALILSTNPTMNTTTLKTDILNHVDPIPAMAGLVHTGGRLNVCKAIPGCQRPLAATAQAVPGAGGRSAALAGFVSPQETSTSYFFKYSINPNMSGATSTAPQSAGSGGTSQAVSQTATGLQPNATYYFQIVASNVAGTTQGSVVSFATSSGPLAVTLPASAVTGSSAVLNASVNPLNQSAAAYFKYSVNADMSGAISTAPQSAGSGGSSQTVSQSVPGLQPNTTYYFEVVASNKGGPTTSAVASFVTSTPPSVVSFTTLSTKPSYAARVFSGQTLASLRAHGLKIKVRCAASCRMTAQLLLGVAVRTSGHKHHIVKMLGKMSETLTGGRTLRLTIHLSGAGRHALRHATRITLTLQLSAVVPNTKLTTNKKLHVKLR